MELARDRQRLADKRYNDQQDRQKMLDQQREEDREYRREIDFINAVPESQRGAAMAKSSIENISRAGDAILESQNKFNEMLYPLDTESSEYEEKLKGALQSPNLTVNQKKMVNQQLNKIQSKRNFTNARTLIDNLQDGPDKIALGIRLDSGDLDGVLKEINKRESKKKEELSPAEQFTNQLISQPNQIDKIILSIEDELRPELRKRKGLPPLTPDQIKQRVELRRNLVNSRFDLIQPLIQGFAPPESTIVQDKFLKNFD
jgi:glutaredoxin